MHIWRAWSSVNFCEQVLPNLARIPGWSQLGRPSPALFTRKREGFTTGSCSLQARPSLLCLQLCSFAEGQHACIGLEHSSKRNKCCLQLSSLQSMLQQVKRLLQAMPATNLRSFSGSQALPGHKDTVLMSSGTASSPGAWRKTPGASSVELLCLAQERGSFKKLELQG